MARDLATMTVSAGAEEKKIEQRLEKMRVEGFTRRFWGKDHTLWTKNAAEAKAVSGYMGWLSSVNDMIDHPEPIEALKEGLAKEGVEQVVLMGMGGSSLAPEVFARTF